jgi:hypothetical protein
MSYELCMTLLVFRYLKPDLCMIQYQSPPHPEFQVNVPLRSPPYPLQVRSTFAAKPQPAIEFEEEDELG